MAQNVLVKAKKWNNTTKKRASRYHLMRKEILTIEEAASFLQIGKKSLYRLVKEGIIPGKKILNKWRFERELLKEWVREGDREQQKNEQRLKL